MISWGASATRRQRTAVEPSTATHAARANTQFQMLAEQRDGLLLLVADRDAGLQAAMGQGALLAGKVQELEVREVRGPAHAAARVHLDLARTTAGWAWGADRWWATVCMRLAVCVPADGEC